MADTAPRTEPQTASLYCPRGAGPDSPFTARFDGSMEWDDANCCSYCGSLNPDEFMARLEDGDVELGPTDKNYKVYVLNRGGNPIKQHYRDCPGDSKCTGPDDCTHWTTRETSQGKFYFQHLSEDQRMRFVEMLNERQFGFYVLPFFATKGT